MGNYVILAEAVIDVPRSFFKENNMHFVFLSYTLGDKTSYDDFGETMPYDDFYRALREGVPASTAQANVDDFAKVFEEEAEKGNDVVYIGFSSALSGSYNAGLIAAADVKKKYPDFHVYPVDSLCASGGHGLLVRFALQKKNEGASAPELQKYLEDLRLQICHWFTVDDLFYLQRGGRVSKTSALLGSLIGIRPVLRMNDEGKLVSVDKTRGRNKSIEALGEKMKKAIVHPEDQTVRISQADCLKDAEFLRDWILKNVQVKAVEIDNLGTTIGVHSGPGTIALFFVGQSRNVM